MVVYSSLRSYRSSILSGTIELDGDEAISNLALILSAITNNGCTINNLSQSSEALNTLTNLQKLGVTIYKKNNYWQVKGLANGVLLEPTLPLCLGTIGSNAGLLIGLLSAYNMTSKLVKPTNAPSIDLTEILTPLHAMGAQIISTNGDLPITIKPSNGSAPITYRLDEPSYQVKATVLLAGLNTPGVTTVIEPMNGVDHTERMLKAFGAKINTYTNLQKESVISIQGQTSLKSENMKIPSDPAYASFFMVATLITSGSAITVLNVLVNPSRIKLIKKLVEMGADIRFINYHKKNGEPIANIEVKSSRLKAVEINIGGEYIESSNYPILAIAAACADGVSVFSLKGMQLAERKEIETLSAALCECGVTSHCSQDYLTITGGNQIAGGNLVKAKLHPHISMSLLVLGLVTRNAITIEDGSIINNVFPSFINCMREIGATIYV